ncbi:MAG TPA: hypothetical protein VF070_23070 [Streptosporangiaceae bacterium]
MALQPEALVLLILAGYDVAVFTGRFPAAPDHVAVFTGGFTTIFHDVGGLIRAVLHHVGVLIRRFPPASQLVRGIIRPAHHIWPSPGS